MADEDERFDVDAGTAGALSLLAEFVEQLIVPRKLSASTIQGLARVLLILRRVPRVTESICGSITIDYRVNDELRYSSIDVADAQLSLTDGGSVYDPGVGTDSYSHQRFQLSLRGVRGSDNEIYAWIDETKELLRLGATVSVDTINDDDGIDWDEFPSHEEA